MKTKTLIKEFVFDETARPEMVFTSPEIRLPAGAFRIELDGRSGSYPIGANYSVRTRKTDPGCLKKWLSFQADVDAPPGTSIGFRLSKDGTTDLWWDGTAWSVPGANDWNDEAEIATNISSLAVGPEQAIQAVINLRTTSASVTPIVRRLKLLYASDVNFQEDYIVRSLRKSLFEALRPVSMFASKSAQSVSSVDLNKIEQPYDIIGVDSAFDLGSDPKRLADIKGSFNSGTKLLQLSNAVAANNQIEVRFVYRPKVSIVASQDYKELDKVPAVVIEDVSVQETFRNPIGEHVLDKATAQAWRLDDSFQANIEFTIRIIAGSERDLTLLADEVKDYFASHKLLRSVGQDEQFPLLLTSPYNQTTNASQTGLHSGRLRGRIANAVFYQQNATDVSGVLRLLTAGGNLNLDISSN